MLQAYERTIGAHSHMMLTAGGHYKTYNYPFYRLAEDCGLSRLGARSNQEAHENQSSASIVLLF